MPNRASPSGQQRSCQLEIVTWRSKLGLNNPLLVHKCSSAPGFGAAGRLRREFGAGFLPGLGFGAGRLLRGVCLVGVGYATSLVVVTSLVRA